MKPRRLAAAVLLALAGPLPLPHVDTYLPLGLGVFAAVAALKDDGPTYLALMTGVLLVYALAFYGLLSLVVRARAQKEPPR